MHHIVVHVMAQNTTTSDARTETERFDGAVSAADLIEGDRLDKRLVARHPSQLGEPIQPTMPEKDDHPDTQFVLVTALDRMADVHSALLYDPETELFIRAGRHGSQQAWTQAEADWTVRDVGSKPIVEEVHDLERPENEQDQDAHEYVQEWVEILFDDIRYTDGDTDMQDERELDGTTLKLNDYDGRKTLATITLED
jgi:hypothetical protein